MGVGGGVGGEMGIVDPDLVKKVLVQLGAANRLQNQTLFLALSAGALGALLAVGSQGSSGGMLEDLSHSVVGSGRALQVLAGANLLGHGISLLGRDGSLGRSSQLLDGLGVVSQVDLATDQQNRHALAKVQHLGDPLLLHVVERVGAVDGEADDDDVGVGVGQGSQSVVILLAGGIPQGQLHSSAVNLHVGHVVLKHGGHVHLREGALREDNQQTGLAAGSVADNDEFSSQIRWLGHFSKVLCVGE
ncbi:glycine-rich protein [Yarrowia lipolytica]|jgi:hypothetical protein|uniref:Glycine-rich protein n=1 Tax=Yarrowia lipolytica TaxID=4952 RepID=Q9HGU8_YARLL|nr:glycine-rich protein [Yarrowia lipolytica]KAB8282562.1 glycine-rich protein [Yarrowia lipolytica]KAE8173212.1 glycine-rich protein [Yarrowia lipolytica]KAJ8054934.1 glycine-rich protein [Yarrowia lipolytica]RDW26253.1 glycine-rich protein [Yarrowia lipolytica]